MARIELPPEAFKFSRSEVAHVRKFESEKDFNGLLLHADEPVPATGSGETPTGTLTIPRGSTDCLVLHLDDIGGAQDARRQLALAGTYVGVHEALRSRRFMVGVTHGVIARLAVRGAGFERLAIRGGAIDLEYYKSLRNVYYDLYRQPWPTPRATMIYMPVPDFIATFANQKVVRRYGPR